MKIHIKSLAGDFDVEVGPSGADSTVLDMKKEIEFEQGIDPTRQFIYLNGYLVNDDNARMDELVQVGGNTFNLVLFRAGDISQTFSDEEIFLITGTQTNFETQLIMPKRKMCFEVKSKKFGIVYNEKVTKIGKRKYHAEVFEVKKGGTIRVTGEDKNGEMKVVLIQEQDPESPGEELLGVVETYNEATHGQNSNRYNLMRAGQVLNIIDSLSSFITFLAQILGEGN